MLIFVTPLFALEVDRRGVSLTLLPHPRRHFLTVAITRPSGIGWSFRFALLGRSMSVGYRTLAGTWIGVARKSRVHVHHFDS